VSPGGTGELLLRGDSITSGYLDQQIETTTLKGEEWFATGDLASADEDGVYWLVGRKKNIIIVGGRNVYPDEINNVLLSHSDVTEAATLGLPDEIWGERVVSCVVAKGPVTVSALLDYAAKNLTEYKVPREIHFLADLPKGRSGKILLNELMKQLQDVSSSNSVFSDLEGRVIKLASESFRIPVSEISLKTAPANCSRWDSVAHMDFVTNLETNFGVELLPREIIQITSIDAAVRIVGNKRITPGETG
jgi:long-chain acyl-CoA synthetase